MYQQTQLIGHLGKDPELRYTPSGVPVCQFSIAIDRSSTDKSGNKMEKTLWVSVIAWNQLGELCAQYLKKGRQVFVSGDLEEPEKWIDKASGDASARNKITARTVKFLGKNEDHTHEANTVVGESPANVTPNKKNQVSEEDIPF